MADRSKKQQFAISEFAVLAWAASVQRVRIYVDRTAQDAEDLRVFRRAVLGHLQTKILPIYTSRIDEATHVEQIEALVIYGTNVGGSLLGDTGYRYGVAQKLLNLQLKYLWCLDRVAEPPHCPIDRVVIEKTALRGQLNWTEIGNRTQYLRAVEAVREQAMLKQLSIAQWELEEYQRR